MTKNIFITLVLLFTFAISSVYAGFKSEIPKGRWHPISIYNHTDHDVAYVMNGTYGGAPYGVQHRNVDIYHSGMGDQNASFEIGVCYDLPANGAPCTKNGPVIACAPGHYNAELIKSIEINALDSCVVTCTDENDQSCRLG